MKKLVFWHGWGMRSGAWHPLTTLLADRQTDHPTLELASLPGYDGTPYPAPYTPEAVVDAMLAEQTQPITLCGWSLGALLAMLAAHRHPEKIEKLILISATPSFIQRTDWSHAISPAMLTEFSAAIRADAESALKRFITLFNHNDPHAKENVRELGNFTLAPQAVLQGGLDILRELDVRHMVSGIPQPTLLIHGTRDPLMPLAAAEWLAATLPDATLKTVAEAAHAPFISEPAYVANLITAWLEPS